MCHREVDSAVHVPQCLLTFDCSSAEDEEARKQKQFNIAIVDTSPATTPHHLAPLKPLAAIRSVRSSL